MVDLSQGTSDTVRFLSPGGTDTITGFAPTSGDILDLSQLLGGVTLGGIRSRQLRQRDHQRRGRYAERHGLVRDAGTMASFVHDLAAHSGDPEATEEVCIDMSPAFIKGVGDSLPNAAITFNKFYAVKIVNDATDLVRRAEATG